MTCSIPILRTGSAAALFRKDDEGEVLGAAAILRDVSIRWQRDQEMRRRLAALAGQGGGGASPDKEGLRTKP